MFINELFAHLHLFGIHRIGLGHLQYEGLFEINGMVKRSSQRKFPILWFVEDIGVLSVLWGKFLFNMIRSTEMEENGIEDSTARGVNPGPMGWVFTLAAWQLAHPEMNFHRKVDIPGYQ